MTVPTVHGCWSEVHCYTKLPMQMAQIQKAGVQSDASQSQDWKNRLPCTFAIPAYCVLLQAGRHLRQKYPLKMSKKVKKCAWSSSDAGEKEDLGLSPQTKLKTLTLDSCGPSAANSPANSPAALNQAPLEVRSAWRVLFQTLPACLRP